MFGLNMAKLKIERLEKRVAELEKQSAIFYGYDYNYFYNTLSTDYHSKEKWRTLSTDDQRISLNDVVVELATLAGLKVEPAKPPVPKRIVKE